MPKAFLMFAVYFWCATQCNSESDVTESLIESESVRNWRSDNNLNEADRNDFLVKAKTISSDTKENTTRTLMRIEHVYFGPQFLNGKIFRVESPTMEPEGSGPFVVYPAPKLHDIGLWRLRTVNDRLSSAPTGSYFFGVALPAFQTNRDNYELALSFCKSIEEVIQITSQEKRLTRLRQLAVGKNPEVARWAVAILARDHSGNAEEFLLQLTQSKSATIGAQVAADRALIAVESKSWQYSKKRIAMMDAWVKRKLAAPDAKEIKGYFSEMVQRMDYMGVGKQTALELLTVAVLSDKIPLESRCDFVRVYRVIPRRFGHEKVLHNVADLILESSDDAVKLEAAKAIIAKYDLAPGKHRAILRKVMESEKSGEGGRYLREQLDIDSLK